MRSWIRRWRSRRPRIPRLEDRTPDILPLYRELRRSLACYTNHEFSRRVAPIFDTLHSEMITGGLPRDDAETALRQLLGSTIRATRRRQLERLPVGHPGIDYRKYQEPYTYALVSAMAVECWLSMQSLPSASAEEGVKRLLPVPDMATLKADSVVWGDWLGYFDSAAPSALRSLAHPVAAPDPATTTRQSTMVDSVPASEPPTSSDRGERPAGWVFVEALKGCLDDGSLSLNQPGDLVQVDAKGRLFIRKEAFEAVATLRGLDTPAKTLENQFNRLKLTQRNSEGRGLHRGRSLASERWVRGYVVSNTDRLWSGELPRGRFVIEGLSRA